MSAVISWMAAEGERPVEMDIPPFDLASPDGEATLRAGSCRKERDKGGATADSSQESVGMESFPPNENRPSTSLRAGSGWGTQLAPLAQGRLCRAKRDKDGATLLSAVQR